VPFFAGDVSLSGWHDVMDGQNEGAAMLYQLKQARWFD
jgi:hypothetical protein